MNTAISHGITQNEKRIYTGGMEYMRYFSLYNGDHKLVGIGTGIGDKVTHNGKLGYSILIITFGNLVCMDGQNWTLQNN